MRESKIAENDDTQEGPQDAQEDVQTADAGRPDANVALESAQVTDPPASADSGALPIDIDISMALQESEIDDIPMEDVADDGDDEAAIDFGGDLGVDDGVVLDDIDLDDMDIEIGAESIEREDDADGALPLGIDLGQTTSDLEFTVSSEGPPEPVSDAAEPDNPFDLWDANLAGEWSAEQQSAQPSQPTVRSILSSEGVDVEDVSVRLAPLYTEGERTQPTIGSTRKLESVQVIAATPLSDEPSLPPTSVAPENRALLNPTAGAIVEPGPLEQSGLPVPKEASESGISYDEFDESVSLLRQLSMARREYLDLFVDESIAESEVLVAGKDRTVERVVRASSELVEMDAEDLEIELELDDADVDFVFDESHLEDAIHRLSTKDMLSALEHENDDSAMVAAQHEGESVAEPVDGLLEVADGEVEPVHVELVGMPIPLARLGLSGWKGELGKFLETEIELGESTKGVARSLHTLARLADLVDAEEASYTCLETARQHDANHVLNRWSVLSRLESSRSFDALSALLEASNRPGERYQAGHAIRRQGGEPQMAWSATLEDDPAAALACYFENLRRYQWGDAERALARLQQQEFGQALKGVWALQSAQLSDELSGETEAGGSIELAMKVPAVALAAAARAELHGVETGNLMLLRRALERLLEQFPLRDAAQLVTLKKLALTQNRSGNFSAAFETYKRVLEKAPTDRDALRRGALIARRMGRVDDLRVLMQRLAETSRTPQEAALRHYENGMYLQRFAEDESGAEASFQAALNALPTFTPALARLSRISRLQGRHGEIQRRYVAEIDQLEKTLEAELGPEDRVKAIQGLVRRYFRLARSFRDTENAGKSAELYKRALALDPDFKPALYALEAHYREAGAWPQLISLLVGWSLRTRSGTRDTVPALLQAADIARTQMDDRDAAGQLLARALNLEPQNAYALQRAEQHFAALGNLPALVEVSERRLRRSQSRADRLRLASLQSLSQPGDSGLQAALSTYISIVRDDPTDSSALEGIVRSLWGLERRLASIDEFEEGAVVEAGGKQLVWLLVDALHRDGSFAAAAQLLARWRNRARVAALLSEQEDASALWLLAALLEGASDWSGLVDVLYEIGERQEGPASSVALAIAGSVSELRLGDLTVAETAYRRALERDPENRSARAGLQRLVALGGNLASPWAGDREVALAVQRLDRVSLAGRLASNSRSLPDDEDAAAMLSVALPMSDDRRALYEAFLGNPRDGRLFDALRRLLERDSDHKALVEVIELHMPHCESAKMQSLLSFQAGLYLRLGRLALATETVERLMRLAPNSLVGRLLLRRLALSGGDEAQVEEISSDLLAAVRSPQAAAEIQFALARTDPSRDASEHLESAISLDPTNVDLAVAYEAVLEGKQEWGTLIELHRARLQSRQTPKEDLRVSSALARLLSEVQGRSAEGLQILSDAFERHPPDVPALLTAARLATKTGSHGAAARYFDAAMEVARAESPELSTSVAVEYAAALFETGDIQAAQTILEHAEDESALSADALRLTSEIAAHQKDWRGVVRAKRRLISVSEGPAEKALHAAGIGEVFSRVYQDHHRGLDWFARSNQFDPLNLRLTERMISELSLLPVTEANHSRVHDVLENSARVRVEALREGDAIGEHLDALFRIRGHQGDTLGQLRVAQVLGWLGLAGDETKEVVESRQGRFALRRPISTETRDRYLAQVDPQHRLNAIFQTTLDSLVALWAEPMPVGVPRLSKRSFREWQDQFVSVAQLLGTSPSELWNGGRAFEVLTPRFLPHPAIVVPMSSLEHGFDAESAFSAATLLADLRSGGALFRQFGRQEVALSLLSLSDAVRGQAAAESGVPNARRLPQAASLLTRSGRLLLEGLDETQAGIEAELEAVERTLSLRSAQCGLLVIGDIHAALDCLVFGGKEQASHARRTGGLQSAFAGHRTASWLVRFFVSDDFGELCRFEETTGRGGIA